jgi:prepilin-type N-terminal cleavage/methylation domain-containing protein
MKKASQKNKKAGFTLLELLLGISLFCIVAVAIYSSMAIGIKVHKKGGLLTGKYNDVSFAFTIIEKDLRSAMCINNVYFSGSSENMSFYSVQKYSGINEELCKITFSTERERDFMVLRRLIESYQESLQSQHIKGDILINDLSACSLDYGYMKREVSGEQSLLWKKEWKGESVPRYVRINFDIKGEKFTDVVFCSAGKFGEEKEQ